MIYSFENANFIKNGLVPLYEFLEIGNDMLLYDFVSSFNSILEGSLFYTPKVPSNRCWYFSSKVLSFACAAFSRCVYNRTISSRSAGACACLSSIRCMYARMHNVIKIGGRVINVKNFPQTCQNVIENLTLIALVVPVECIELAEMREKFTDRERKPEIDICRM